MTDGISTLERRVGELARRLRTDPNPETDLWPGIAAQIDTEAPPQLRRLPREIEAGRDLWPGIRARIGARDARGGTTAKPGLRRSAYPAAVGALAVAALGLLFTLQVQEFRATDGGPADVAPGQSAALPAWMAEAFAQFGGAASGTPAAALGDAARSIERDFLMVRSERLRIEQAIAVSGTDLNLQTQWRQVYLAELRLIDETQKLASIYGTRIRI